MPARTDGRVENHAVVRFDHVDDGLHDGGRREELAVVVRALLGELGEKILVDAAEHVAGGPAQGLRIEGPHHLFQDVVFETLVVLRQLSGERRKALLHGFHRGGHRCAKIAVLRLLQQHVETRLLRQHHCTPAGEIGCDQRTVRQRSILDLSSSISFFAE